MCLQIIHVPEIDDVSALARNICTEMKGVSVLASDTPGMEGVSGLASNVCT